MDRTTPLREGVVRKAEASQGLESGLFEVVEIDRVIDVPEGIQLVGTGFDYGLGDAQFSVAFRSRETRPAIPLGSPWR